MYEVVAFFLELSDLSGIPVAATTRVRACTSLSVIMPSDLKLLQLMVLVGYDGLKTSASRLSRLALSDFRDSIDTRR